MALEAGVGRIVVDNPTELRRLSAIAGEMGKTAPVYLRITPGVEAHTHSFIRTGQIDSKFGFTLESGEALQGAEEAVRLDAIALKGFHCHIGSQIFDDEPFVHAAEVMLGFMDQVRQRTGTVAGELNLGGGFGAKYVESDRPKSRREMVRLVAGPFRKKRPTWDIPVRIWSWNPAARWWRTPASPSILSAMSKKSRVCAPT